MSLSDLAPGKELVRAILEKDFRFAERLIDSISGTNPDFELALRLAIGAQSLDIALQLIHRGANVKAVEDCDFENCIENDNVQILLSLLPYCSHIPPQYLLEYAAKHYAINCARTLLELGAKPDMQLEMTHEMRDLFESHQNKARLSKKVKSAHPGITLEPGL